MKKSEYLELKYTIENSIKILNERLNELKDEYIESNREFPNGQKVEITTKEHPYWTLKSGDEPEGIIPEKTRISFITGYKIDFRNEVIPIFKKSKKDGKISKRDYYFNERLDSLKPL